MPFFKKHLLSILGVAFGAAGLICFLQELVIAGLSLTLIACFTGIAEFRYEPGYAQLGIGTCLVLLLGIELDLHLGTSFPYYTLLLALALPQIYFRNLRIDKGSTGFYKSVHIEVILALITLIGYFLINGYTDPGWVGYAFPAPLILFSYYFTILNVLGRQSFHKAKGSRDLIEEGEQVPDLELKDQNGDLVRLSDELRNSNVLLFFMRADWCPACRLLLRTYDKHRDKFTEKNVTILAVSPSPVEVNKSMVGQLGVKHKVLADEELEAAKAFRVYLNDEWPMQNPGEQFPPTIPSSFLLDQGGYIRYIARPDRANAYIRPENILPVLEDLEGQGSSA